MKALIILTAFILTIPLGIALFQVSVSSFAYAKEVNQSNTLACESIPPARPTGGASSTRLQTSRSSTVFTVALIAARGVRNSRE
ncbi:hypothetical protein [Scytonema sp. NUACC26]|uniref:hypothetical protein n=1 Tax=Scytonema sp. NUACC26 TaxID=3140176 RepID=UPI0034DC791A